MAILINGHQLTKTFASRNLFRNISFSIEDGERVGLIGPNGAGKSTLLKILARQMEPDDGSLSSRRGLRIGYLAQVPIFKDDATVLSTLLEGADPAHVDDWETMARADEIMSRLGLSGTAGQNEDLGIVFTGESLIKELSGGWKKRVALARELMKEPDLLLLDEPTNHLDLESILWLENFVAQAKFATLIITHDRVFLQKVSNRIIELDRRHPDGLLSVKGSYADFLEGRAILLAGQAAAEVRMRNTLRRETEWLRRGAKARTTKQTARINRHEDLASAVDEITARNQSSVANLDFKSFEKNPKKLIEAKGISKKYGSRIIVPPLDLLISPKTRIGLLGANGCGKSTLIRLLLQREQPDAGTILHADRIQVAYFEQNRESLDPTLSLQKTVCPEGDFVDFAGSHIHVKSYLQRFLFSYEQMDLPVGRLSGGEQARLLIARLMLRPANVLVLDEPTNDLDMETLDVLQDVLAEFDGAVVLVSHDRYFLDQVCTRLLAFGVDGHGEKKIVTFADIEQWEQWHELQDQLREANEAVALKDGGKSKSVGRDAKAVSAVQVAARPTAGGSPQSKRKLSYKDQRDLDMMESHIQKAEAALAALTSESQKSEVVSNAKKLNEIIQQMAAAQAEVDRLYARWNELEGPQS